LATEPAASVSASAPGRIFFSRCQLPSVGAVSF
jgi:hypothetical protein